MGSIVRISMLAYKSDTCDCIVCKLPWPEVDEFPEFAYRLMACDDHLFDGDAKDSFVQEAMAALRDANEGEP